jgi:hypothetical protein
MAKRPSVPPPPRQEVLETLMATDWANVMQSMTHIAMSIWKMDDAHAEDLVSAAVEAQLKAAKTGHGALWNPRKHPNLVRHMVWVMRGIRSNEHRKYGERIMLVDPTGEELAAAKKNHPEQILREGARLKIVGERRDTFLARMDKDAADTYLAIEDGRYDPQEFARSHGLTIMQVRAARRRMKYHLQEVIESDEAEPPSSGSGLANPPAKATRHDPGEEDDEGGYES